MPCIGSNIFFRYRYSEPEIAIRFITALKIFGNAMGNIFSEGPFKKPTIKHDHGFLDDGNGGIDTSKKQPPTPEDLWEYAKWVAKLEAAETVRLDLDDATSAYRHFLFGGGTEKKFDYNEFIKEDDSGKAVEKHLLDQARKISMELAFARLAKPPSASTQTATFDLYSSVVGVGGNDFFFPYPKTENCLFPRKRSTIPVYGDRQDPVGNFDKEQILVK